MPPFFRAEFPVTQQYIYLNHAAVAPIATPVYEAMERYHRDLMQHGLVHWREWGAETEKVRVLAAQLINAHPSEIAFTANTSTGLSILANGIDWQAGDNIVTADCEFPSNQQPWLRIQKKHGVTIRYAKEKIANAPTASESTVHLDTKEILSLIDDRTKVVALSFVEFASGFRNDLATIGQYCRDRGILFFVDAIQGLGALQLDVEACCIDALAADAHKFLLGPDGIAILYVSRHVLEQIRPTIVGWTSVLNAFDFTNLEKEWAVGSKRYEPGALNTAGIMGLGASIKMMLEIGTSVIESYLLELTDYLCSSLRELNFEVISPREPKNASAVVCCRHNDFSAEYLYGELEKARIITTPRLGRLRISPHFYNTTAEIDILMQVLKNIVSKRVSI